MSESILQEEIAYRREMGVPEYSLAGIKTELARLGYRLDRELDCLSTTTWMSGPREGKSYPVITTGITEIDTGLSFAHVKARRDDNFRALQKLRKAGAYVVLKRTLLEI